LAAWLELGTPLQRFLKSRDLNTEIFFDRVRANELVDQYYEVRTAIQLKIDTELVQVAQQNLLDAVRAGDLEVSRFCLERRSPLAWGPPEVQLRLMEKIRALGGENLPGEALDLRVVGLGGSGEQAP
jgi:hypothetical protein